MMLLPYFLVQNFSAPQMLMHFPVGETALDTKLHASNLLAIHLADVRVLQAKTRTFYWSLEGVNLTSVHALLDGQVEAMEAITRPLGEQIRALGSNPPGAFSEHLELTRIKEAASAPISGEMAVQVLLRDHDRCIQALLNSLEDAAIQAAGTDAIQCLTRALRAHQQQADVLRDFLDF